MQDKVNKKSLEKLSGEIKLNDGIFVINSDELNTMNLTQCEYDDIIKPYYTSQEIKKYSVIGKNKEWIIYTDSSFKNIKKIEKYPNIKKHLDKYQNIMTSVNKPYGLHRSREEFIFKGEKILSIRKCVSPSFSYTDRDSYVSRAFLIIKTDRLNNKYLVGLLNSKIVAYWLKNKGKIQGSNCQIDKEPLLNIPLPQPDVQTQQLIINLVNQIILLKQDYINADTSEQEAEIDKIVYQLYDLTDDEIKIVEESL